MTIRTIINRKVMGLITADEHEVFLSLAERLKKHDIGVLLVMDLAGGLLGIVSERDLVRAIASGSANALALTAQDLMTRKVIVCSPNDTELDVMMKMVDRHIRHMPVVDDGRVVGLVSLADVVKQRLTKLGHSVGETRATPSLDSIGGSFSRHLAARVR